MKKQFGLLTILILSGLNMQSQYALPEKGKQLNAGVGLSTWGIPVFLGMDFGVDTDISAGFEFSYRNFNQHYYGKKYSSSILGFSGNGNYHLNGITNIPTQYDVYAGLNVGFYVWNSSGDYPGSQSSGIGIGAQIGARYYFNDKTAVNIEFGGGNAFSGGKIGLSFKL